MDLSVHDAILEAERKRIKRSKVSREDILCLYWDSWDRHFPDVSPQLNENLELIRFGETCIANYFTGCSPIKGDETIAADVGAVHMTGETSILIPIDTIRRRGKTAVVCNFITEPVLKTTQDLINDPLMCLRGKWALDNIKGCRNAVIRWEFLGSGTAVESPIFEKDITEAKNRLKRILEDIESDEELLPHESEYCAECPYRSQCPRFLHQLSLPKDLSDVTDEGVSLVDQYAELQEKIDALKRRQKELEIKRDLIGEKLSAYSESKGYMSVVGNEYKALVRTDTKVILPEDKSEIIRTLKKLGKYDELSMVNYPRLRSDISRGVADPIISKMATIERSKHIYLRRRSD